MKLSNNTRPGQVDAHAPAAYAVDDARTYRFMFSSCSAWAPDQPGLLPASKGMKRLPLVTRVGYRVMLDDVEDPACEDYPGS